MEIRKATKEDSAGLARVQVDSFQTTYAGILPQSYLKQLSCDEQKQDWYDLISSELNKVLYVAQTNSGEIAGYASGKHNSNEIVPYESELVALHVLGEYQRQGVGYQLFASVSRELKNQGSSSLFVWVLADNPARSFYEKHGGVLAGEKPWQNNEYFDTKVYEVAYGWLDIRSLLKEDGH